MTDTIVGLDIGKDAIKAAWASRKGRSHLYIHGACAVALSDTIDTEAALRVISEKLEPGRARCVVALPLWQVMFRKVTLPFRDDRRIRKTLPFELESLLPVDRIVYDYIKLQDQSLLAAACAHDTVAQIIAQVERVLGPVMMVDVSGATLALSAIDVAGDTPILVLDVGHKTTDAVFCEKGAITGVRSFPFGGETITRRLALDLESSFDEAESAKLRGTPTSSAPEALAACAQFASELKNTLEFLRVSNTIQHYPEKIVLCGGGALYAPLSDAIREQIGVTPQKLDLLGPDENEADPPIRDAVLTQTFHTAIATARRLFVSKRSFNFRQGDLALQNTFSGYRHKLKRVAIAAAIVVALAAANLFVDYQARATEADRLRHQINSLFQKHFTKNAVMVDPIRQMNQKITAGSKAFGIQDGLPQLTVADMLKEISTRVGPAYDVTLTNFYFENKAVLIKGRAQTIDDVTAIQSALAASDHFTNVSLGSTTRTREGSALEFEIRLELP